MAFSSLLLFACSPGKILLIRNIMVNPISSPKMFDNRTKDAPSATCREANPNRIPTIVAGGISATAIATPTIM